MFYLAKVKCFCPVLKADYDKLIMLVEQLGKRVTELEEEICLLKNGRNSNTSSTPPSQDIERSNKNSLRERSGKPSGGQKGQCWTHLAKSRNP
jgi:hypothetical protein